MKIYNFFIYSALFFLATLSSCTPSQTEPDATNNLNLKTEQVMNYTYSSLEVDVMKAVNDYRASKGLKVLTTVNHISYVAGEHDKAMISNKSLTHQFYTERLNNIVKVLGASVVGENLAYNFATADIVLKGWIESEKHKVVLEGDFTHFGISIQISPEENKNYCTLILAKLN